MPIAEPQSAFATLFAPLSVARALLLSILLIGTALAGYWFGRYWHDLDQEYIGALESQRLSLMREQADLSTELVNIRLQNSVGRQAANVMREDLMGLREQRESLNNELVFYRSLMAPGKLAKGLQVADLELFPKGSGKFTYHLVLTQVTNQRARVIGKVTLSIGGERLDAESGDAVDQVYSLTDLAEVDEYPLPYRFRYFQDINGELNLPDGFNPKWVEVTADRKGKKAIQRRFDWPEVIPAEYSGLN